MSGSFAGKKAFITGAGSGMGREVALGLAAGGADVFVTDLNAASAAQTVELMRADRRGSRSAVLDVTDSAAVDRCVAEAEAGLGTLDLLVNIAGIYQSKPFEAITDADWLRMMNVHVNGMFYVARAVLRGMVARRRGTIVNMCSLHALRGQANAVHYSAAKGAVLGMTRALAREKAPLGIRVNCVAPGPIDTPLWRAGRTGAQLEADKAERSKLVPLGRLGEASEVAKAILFLLSEDSSYITGQVLPIDGGEVMH